LEILDSQVAENYRKKISGFETKNQLKQYLSAEPQPKEKVALGYVRSKDLGKLKKTNTFYFLQTVLLIAPQSNIPFLSFLYLLF
jgi:hypothetical protein